MSIRVLSALTLCAAVGAGSAFAREPFTASVPIGEATARIVLTFHSNRAKMVECTDEQVALLGARAVERLTELTPVLSARLVSREGQAASGLEVLLDAACYEEGFMGLGGYGRGDERITLSYEESVDGAEWGPPAPAAPITNTPE